MPPDRAGAPAGCRQPGRATAGAGAAAGTGPGPVPPGGAAAPPPAVGRVGRGERGRADLGPGCRTVPARPPPLG
jgi:hypothetical protein